MILVTGSKGFIGRNLVAKLNELEYDVYELYRDRRDRTPSDVFDKLTMVPWEKIKRIYHLGAITNTQEGDVDELYQFNTKFSIDLITIADCRRIPIHYASSAAVYGRTCDAAFDAWSMNPLNFYAMSKATVDMWVQDNMRGRNVVGFRFYNVYGKYENKWGRESMISKFLDRVDINKPIQIFENSGSVYRDFVCVEDVVDILLKRYDPGIYDVGTCNARCVEEIAELIGEKFNTPVETIPFPEKLRPKYQWNTRAMPARTVQFPCKSVESWLDEQYK